MVNYQDAKIYKLVGGGLTYYGSTCNELRIRLYQHKSNINKCKSKQLFNTGDKVDIVLVEKYPCNDKLELHQRERYHIENNECINKVIPTRTDKQYYEDNKNKIKQYYESNKDKIKEKNKEYREDNKDKIKEYFETNKDKIKEYLKEYYESNKDKIIEQKYKYYETNKDKIKERKNEKIKCECGKIYTQSNKSRHKQSKKHIQFINKK